MIFTSEQGDTIICLFESKRMKTCSISVVRTNLKPVESYCMVWLVWKPLKISPKFRSEPVAFFWEESSTRIEALIPCWNCECGERSRVSCRKVKINSRREKKGKEVKEEDYQEMNNMAVPLRVGWPLVFKNDFLHIYIEVPYCSTNLPTPLNLAYLHKSP